MLQFVGKHGFVYKLLVFRPERVVFSLNIVAEFHGSEITRNRFRDAGEKRLNGREDIADSIFRYSENIKVGDDPVKDIGAGSQEKEKRDQGKNDAAENWMTALFTTDGLKIVIKNISG